MSFIGTCQHCAAQLRVDDVAKTRPTPNAPHHIALIGNCPYCAGRFGIAAERSVWHEVKMEHDKSEREVHKQMTAARIELDYVDDVGDLLALWASYPGAPLMEVPSHTGCSCSFCRDRRNRTPL